MRASNISRGRQILARFLVLAEERLAYLSELYDSGRWTRYFTQAELLDNVRDARKAVDAWKLLVSTEALPNNRPVNLDWLNTGRPLPPRKPLMIHSDQPRLSARPAAAMPAPSATVTKPAPSPVRLDFREAAAPIRLKTTPPLPAPMRAAVTPPSAAPATPAWQNALDFALMRERYPLLRKTG